MKVLIFWSYVIRKAKECGNLRKQGKELEADLLQNQIDREVRMADEMVLDIPHSPTRKEVV